MSPAASDRDVERLWDEVSKLQERNQEMSQETTRTFGELSAKLAQIGSDLDWLKRSYWVIATAAIGAVIGQAAQLLAR